MKHMDNLQWPDGVKKTKPRQRVIEALVNAVSPLSAADLFEQIMRAGDSIPLSTIYRTLDLLVKNGMVIKLPVGDAGISLFELNRHEHKHYAVCMGCRKTIDLEYCPLESATHFLQESGFHVLGHRLELYGYCNECSAKNNLK